VQFRFFNAPEQSSLTGNFSMLPGATRADTLAMMAELQRAVEAVGAAFEAEHGLNPVEFVMAEVGGGSGRGLASAATKDADLLGGISRSRSSTPTCAPIPATPSSRRSRKRCAATRCWRN
jgi:hypothetical protein